MVESIKEQDLSPDRIAHLNLYLPITLIIIIIIIMTLFIEEAQLAHIKKMARSPASRLADDFLVSYQPAVTSAKVSCQPAGRRPESLLPASY